MASESSSNTKVAFGIACAIGLCGCAATQRVNYSVESVPHAENSNIAHAKLIIGPLQDGRHNTPGNEILFNATNETTINGESYCINAEEGYSPNSVATQISGMLALHLRKRGTIRAVSAGAPVAQAYYLSGTLVRYYGAQKSTSVSPATGFLFGAVGAAIAASATPNQTPGTISIEIVDLALHDGSGKPIARLPDIRYTTNGNLRAATDCLVVYDNINEHLRRVFGDYVHSVEEVIANATHGEQPQVPANAEPGERPAVATRARQIEQPKTAAAVEQDKQPPAEPW